jgi:hypothetical protein
VPVHVTIGNPDIGLMKWSDIRGFDPLTDLCPGLCVWRGRCTKVLEANVPTPRPPYMTRWFLYLTHIGGLELDRC